VVKEIFFFSRFVAVRRGTVALAPRRGAEASVGGRDRVGGAAMESRVKRAIARCMDVVSWM
jgi:hypothetical protein